MNSPLTPAAPAAPAAQTAQSAQSAATRLDESRERLRRALLGDVAGTAGDGREPPRPSATPRWLASLQDMPVVGLLLQAAQAWWARHPLHLAGTIAVTAADAVVKPIAQRHPLRLVLGAAAVGGLLAWSRPWRWVVAPALFAGLLPQLLSAVLQVQKSAEGSPPRR